jgi:hypothetical protein
LILKVPFFLTKELTILFIVILFEFTSILLCKHKHNVKEVNYIIIIIIIIIIYYYYYILEMQFLDVISHYLFPMCVCLLFVICVFSLMFLCCLYSWPYGCCVTTVMYYYYTKVFYKLQSSQRDIQPNRDFKCLSRAVMYKNLSVEIITSEGICQTFLLNV